MQRLDTIYQHLQKPALGAAVWEGMSLHAQALIPVLQALNGQLAQLKRAIWDTFVQHPEADWWQSFPGAGELTAPRLLAEIGDNRLYAVTTQVTRKDAAALAGVTPWNWHKTYEEPMLEEVRYEFAQVFLERHSYTLPEKQPAANRNNGQFTSPYQNWREQYQQGHTEPAEALLVKYSHTICIAGAIRAQIDGKTYRQAALDIGRNPNTFPKYMKRAARMLAAAYA